MENANMMSLHDMGSKGFQAPDHAKKSLKRASPRLQAAERVSAFLFPPMSFTSCKIKMFIK